ncbi:MAG: PHB depolymerase family esterase [Planctomycetota bacterium]
MQRPPLAFAAAAKDSEEARLAESLATTVVWPEPIDDSEAGVDAWPTTAERTGPQAATFAPLGYESAYQYPLIVWLHGAGADERCLPNVMTHVSVQNFVATAPRGVEAATEGYTWRQSAGAIDRAENAVADAIEHAAERFSVRSSRVFLAGVGSGGTMALRIGLRRPEWFAGVASFDGAMPRGERPLARVNDARRLPLMLSAARESAAYPESRLCRDLALLHSAGCCVEVRQHPGDDDLTTEMLADLNRWVMGLVCG